MSEKIETPTPWPFAPGQIVRDSGEGDDAAWLECAPVGTVVQNAEACEWTRGVHGWFGAHPSWATSADLAERGPLTVVSVPEPTTTLHDCTVDETAGGAETTGAVEAAAEAILEACYGQELPEAPIDLARAALTAALPEIARRVRDLGRAMREADGWDEDWSTREVRDALNIAADKIEGNELWELWGGVA